MPWRMADFSLLTNALAGTVTVAAVASPRMQSLTDLDPWAVVIGAIVAGVAGVGSGLARWPHDKHYPAIIIIKDGTLGLLAGLLMFGVLNWQGADGNLQLAGMVAAGWAPRWLLDKWSRAFGPK